MALGKSIVASRVDGNVDCEMEGVNGNLYDSEDANALADKIENLLSNKEMRHLFSINSKTEFEKRFNINK